MELNRIITDRVNEKLEAVTSAVANLAQKQAPGQSQAQKADQSF